MKVKVSHLSQCSAMQYLMQIKRVEPSVQQKKHLLHSIKGKSSYTVIKAVQKYHEETLNLTSKDFKRACLDADQLALLWKKSLNFERALVELGMPSSGENALKADFDKLAKSTLCKLDVELTLQDEAWGSFFRALNDQKNK
eukprot:CAMPEP_0178823106 /NCGR_PEP_ID=MMETSP0746-20121128/4959_1 /TAXON_ID=913974 /ORGANISM="Nitzschia punctata, Strain CCMP561" /LENGTH=140 /DNA_ID=CAMNT_0020484677 /DNA_START=96 /DNA_END=518 /DNA_ORIENTATION=+